jgi:hypothetical protein
LKSATAKTVRACTSYPPVLEPGIEEIGWLFGPLESARAYGGLTELGNADLTDTQIRALRGSISASRRSEKLCPFSATFCRPSAAIVGLNIRRATHRHHSVEEKIERALAQWASGHASMPVADLLSRAEHRPISVSDETCRCSAPASGRTARRRERGHPRYPADRPLRLLGRSIGGGDARQDGFVDRLRFGLQTGLNGPSYSVADACTSIKAETASADSVVNYLNIGNFPGQSLLYPQANPQMRI